MDKITFCIPSKSNLRYLKSCIASIRVNSFRKDHDIIVFVDEDTDGTVEWLEENKEKYHITYFVNPYIGGRLFGIGKAYDYCIEKSTTDIFMIFHADMILGKDADLLGFNCLERKAITCLTRIEPPLHPNNGEKIQLDFGIYPEDFKEGAFNKEVERLITVNKGKTTEGIFAPWMMYRDEFLALGGHDPRMHSCREDSDVFNRMYLDGFKFVQVWDALVYHFTGRGAGSFSGDKDRHEKWKKDMNNSTMEFIRKWGQNVRHTSLMRPIVHPKYDIGLIIKNCNANLLSVVEPWCNVLYIDESADKSMVDNYITLEQPNTSIDLFWKIRPYDNEKNNEILVEIDGKTFNQEDFNILTNLSEIIKNSGEVGRFSLANLVIEIIQMNEYQNRLIRL